MRISRTEKRSNEEVIEMAGYKRSLLKTTRKRQLQFYGHINRADGLENQIISGKICGTKRRGRQHTKHTDSLINFVTIKESPSNELIGRTDDREDWKAMVAATHLAHDDDDDDDDDDNDDDDDGDDDVSSSSSAIHGHVIIELCVDSCTLQEGCGFL